MTNAAQAAEAPLVVLVAGVPVEMHARISDALVKLSNAGRVVVCAPGELTATLAHEHADFLLVGDDAALPPLAEVVKLAAARDTIVIAWRRYEGEQSFSVIAEGVHDAVFDVAMSRLPLIMKRELVERRDRREIERARRTFHQVLEAAPDAISVHRDGVYLWANARHATLLGYDSPAEVVGHSVADHLHPEDRPLAAQRIATMMASGKPAGLREMRQLRKDGESVAIEVSSLPFEYQGEPAILSISRDVTERKRVQSRLLQADRLAAVGKLAAGVAHEVNNPLSYVIANVGHVQSALPELSKGLRGLHELVPPAGRAALAQLIARIEEARSALADAAEGAERVRVIVRDLKTFSRPDEAKVGPVDLKRVIESSINLAWNEIRHRARLSKEYGQTPLLEANESKLGQVFLNLLTNAAQGIPDGGRDQHEIRVRTATDPDGRLRVDIEDTGSPIPAEQLATLFDPFSTARGGTSGLDLSVCHGLVAQLGGEITVENGARGVRFSVLLPASKVKSEPPPAERRVRVLVVDDEPAVGSALRRMLAPHDVVAVQSGFDALRVLRAGEQYDVVLCDLMMPEMTGMDVHAELARARPGLERKMVFMTGGVFTERAQEFLATVPNARLEKPFRLDELRSVVRKAAQGA